MITITRQGDRINIDYADPYNKHYDENVVTTSIEGRFNTPTKSIIIKLASLGKTLEITLDQVTTPSATTIEDLLAAIQALIETDVGNIPETFTVTAATQSLFTTVMTLTGNFKVERNGSLVPVANRTLTSIHTFTMSPPAEQNDIISAYAQ